MDLTRNQLRHAPRTRLHTGRNVSKASVDLIEIDGRPVVIKDLSDRPWLVRLLLGPWQLDREIQAYGRLDGLPGVPRLLGRIDRQAIALEYISGPKMSTLGPGDLSEEFFDQLDDLIEAMHTRGVAHGDLNRSDVLAGPGGCPYVVDFSTAVLADRSHRPSPSYMFAQTCRVDRRSVAKLRHRFLPGSKTRVPERLGIHRLGHFLKRILNRVRRALRSAWGLRSLHR
jgi:tRNA A-37 threonylcarbamoyl transferase component Bud32